VRDFLTFLIRDCALDDSCVLCSRCFNGSEHEGHNVSFYLAIQPGGCCDCGDPEAWKQDYGCAYHPRGVEPRRAELMIPTELRESMTRTIDAVIEFILDALDGSPEETVPPKDETDLKRLSLPPGREAPLATVLWNDEKHSFTEVAAALRELIRCTHKEGMRLAELIDSEVRERFSPCAASSYSQNRVELSYLRLRTPRECTI
jgi:E3 ubiquitin-protein ligase UBR1